MDWLLILALLQQAEPANPAAVPPTPPAADRATDPSAAPTPPTDEAVSPMPAAPDDVPSDAWVQEARDWLVAVRMAYENMTPAQTNALRRSFEKLPPAALRVLVTVYEHTYGVQSPLSAADLRPPNETEAEREWIMAYRILYDRLSVADAQAYAETLRSMNPRQIRTLLEVYQEKNRQQMELQHQRTAGTSESPGVPAEPRPPASPGRTRTADEEAAARRAMQLAQERMEFEQTRRQMALGRASTARSDTRQAMIASNSAANASAVAGEQRVRRLEAFSDTKALQQSAFQNEMFTRGAFPNSSPGGTFFFRAF